MNAVASYTTRIARPEDETMWRRKVNLNKSIYLSGAMSCYFNTDQHNYPKQWRKDVRKYIDKYYSGISIVTTTDFYEKGKDYHKTDSKVMRFNLRMVRESDIILVNLRDLHRSLGTSDEIFYAFIKGKPIVGFLEDESEYKNVHPWKVEEIDRIEKGRNAMYKAIDYIYEYYINVPYSCEDV